MEVNQAEPLEYESRTGEKIATDTYPFEDLYKEIEGDINYQPNPTGPGKIVMDGFESLESTIHSVDVEVQ